MALIELDKPPTSPGIGTIPTAPPAIEGAILKSSLATISGWGKSTANPDTLSDALLYGTVKITPDKLCASSYGKATDGSAIIQPDMVCANAFPSDACAGDSGGALVMRGPPAASSQTTPMVQKIDYVEGVVSWGYPAGGCPSKKPTVYSRVASAALSDWISKCLKNEPCPSSIP